MPWHNLRARQTYERDVMLRFGLQNFAQLNHVLQTSKQTLLLKEVGNFQDDILQLFLAFKIVALQNALVFKNGIYIVNIIIACLIFLNLQLLEITSYSFQF